MLVLSLSGLCACSGGGGGTTSSGGGGTTGAPGTGGTSGTLTINMTDSPFNDAKAVLVTFSEVQVHHTTNGWITVPFTTGTSRTCDLKKLVGGANDVLGTGLLPAGHYTQIRLVVAQSALYFDNPAGGSSCCYFIDHSLGRECPSGNIIRRNKAQPRIRSGSRRGKKHFTGLRRRSVYPPNRK